MIYNIIYIIYYIIIHFNNNALYYISIYNTLYNKYNTLIHNDIIYINHCVRNRKIIL